jgi:hypothetical protein
MAPPRVVTKIASDTCCFEQFVAGAGDVALQPFGGDLAQRHQALLRALAHHAHHVVVEADLEQADADQLGNAQAGGVEQFEHGAVAQAERGLHVGCAEQVFHLLFRQGLGEALGRRRLVDVEQRITLQPALVQQPAVAAAQRRHQAPLAGRLDAAGAGVQVGEVGVDRRLVGADYRAVSGLREPAGEQREVAAVRSPACSSTSHRRATGRR